MGSELSHRVTAAAQIQEVFISHCLPAIIYLPSQPRQQPGRALCALVYCLGSYSRFVSKYAVTKLDLRAATDTRLWLGVSWSKVQRVPGL